MSANDMSRFWDERAREDALFYVDDRGLRGEAFWEGGEDVVRVFSEQLGIAFGPDDEVVEVGCGVGRLTRAIAGRVRAVTALDVSEEMLALAREHNPHLTNVSWRHGDGRTLTGVPDAGADAVFSHVVFQHVPDPEITLGYVREMGRVLRPGGWAAFQISNDPGVHRRRLWARRQSRHAAWRGSAVDLDALREAAGESGLDVARVVGEGSQFCLVRLARL